jgi:hypothetical protein
VSDNTPFDPSTNEDPNSNTPAPSFQIPTEAADFVGDGKKYKSVEDALKSVPHAQTHIQTLETELATVKEELSKRKTAEELLEQIKAGIQPETTTHVDSFDPNTIYQVVEQTLEAKEKAKVARSNADSVVSKFTAKYGDKAEQAYVALAQESGMSVQQLNALAANSPSVVLKLAGLGSQNAPAGSTSGSVNTEAFGNQGSPAAPSARVPKGATTKDLVSAWRAAGQKVKQS